MDGMWTEVSYLIPSWKMERLTDDGMTEAGFPYEDLALGHLVSEWMEILGHRRQGKYS